MPCNYREHPLKLPRRRWGGRRTLQQPRRRVLRVGPAVKEDLVKRAAQILRKSSTAAMVLRSVRHSFNTPLDSSPTTVFLGGAIGEGLEFFGKKSLISKNFHSKYSCPFGTQKDRISDKIENNANWRPRPLKLATWVPKKPKRRE